ncbi:hypothetical protein VWZ98_08425 [Phaeobacter sp. JH203A]
MKTPVLFTAFAAVSACQIDTHAEIFTSDVYAVLKTKEALETQLTLAFEAGSENGCRKAEQQLKGPLEQAFGHAEYTGCVDVKFDKFAQFRVTADLVGQTDEAKASVPKPVHLAAIAQDNGFVRLEYIFNREEMIALAESVPEELTQFLNDEPDIILSATLSNDLSDNVTVSVVDVFADGKPYKSFTDFDLKRRGSVEIALSNVGNASFGNTEKTAVIGWIPAKAE